MPDPGEKSSTTMEGIPKDTVKAADCDDPLPTPSSSFDKAACLDAQNCVDSSQKMSTIQNFLTDVDTFPYLADYDSVVADLPTFLEMVAAEDDPIKDQAVFFKTPCLWASSKRLVGPDGTFWLFVELPHDIRLMIWEECIPKQIHLVAERIYEGIDEDQVYKAHCAFLDHTKAELLDKPIDDIKEEDLFLVDFLEGLLCGDHRTIADPYHSRHCTPTYPRAFSQKVPVVAQVNQEARRFALRHKSKCYSLAFVHKDMDRGKDRIEEAPVWLNSKKDAVLINTQFIHPTRLPASAVSPMGNNEIEIKADRLFGMVTRNTTQVAVFANALYDTEAPPAFYHALAKADRVDVVVGVFRFDNMSDSEAANTDLFGLFGEESMALISAKNTQLLRKLFEADVAFRPECALESFQNGYQTWQEFYTPVEYQVWNRSRCPSNFRTYRKDMRGFAHYAMLGCKEARRTYLDGDIQNSEWQLEIDASFKDKFVPAFLAHRCRNPVVLNADQ